MAIIRLILLLGLGGGLFLLVQFNWLPLSLTFLGVQTPALPLALWVLGAIGAGIVTNLLITSLFSISNYFAVRAARSRMRQASRQSDFQARSTVPSSEPASYARTATAQATDNDADWNNWEGYEEPRQAASARTSVDKDPIDDWEEEPEDDWDLDDPQDTRVDTRSAPRIRTDYEAKQEPKTTTRNGSVYSYGYSDPQNSGVGKAEPVVDKPVVDADYRVIVPPFRSLDDTPNDKEVADSDGADDWFEDGDDEFKDRNPRRDRP
ncbi:MAG: LapA family protein [Stenomitos frigidus ULC029]